MEAEAAAKIAPLQLKPREFVHDPVLLEFLGLSHAGKLLEAELEQALLDNLQAFLLELGKGFAFVTRQQRISTESKDFYLDMVFYNYLLKCFVLFDFKTGTNAIYSYRGLSLFCCCHLAIKTPVRTVPSRVIA